MENLKGSITEIIYYNNDNGYFVGILENKELQTTVVGTLAGVEKGASYNFLGTWKQHSTYGEQFVFSEFLEVKPETPEALVTFLSSGAIKGIGPKLAAIIVEKFGRDTLNVLDNDIESLSEISGIGRKKLEGIKESYNERKEFMEVSMYFQEHGISTGYALKLYKIYGHDTIDIINENPYRLIREIPRIGFQKVDQIAQKLGIDKNSESRVQQGIIYFMWRLAGDGSTYIPETEFKEKVGAWLDVPGDLVASSTIDLILEGILSMELIDERKCIFLSQYNDAEKRVCKNLFDLKNTVNSESVANAEAVIKQVEDESGIMLAENQKEAVKFTLEENISVITGGPGTGKTTIINTIIKIFKNTGKRVAIAAPTGRAAKRITETSGEDALTIHRLLEYYYSDSSEEMIFGKNRENKLDYDVVIIDEISMVDLMLMDALLEALKYGTRLIMVGDADQLPPVGAGSVLRDILDSDIMSVVKLKEIFRQAGESLITVNAHRINKGEYPFYNEKGKDFFLLRKDSDQEILDTVIDLCGNRLPDYIEDCEPVKDIQILTPSKKGMIGSINLNKELQRLFNPQNPKVAEKSIGERIFREGDKVMQIRNNYKLSWKNMKTFEEGEGIFNGDVGYIDNIDLQNNTIGVIFDNIRYVVYEFSELDELDLAYAVTVHKSQGSEFPVVIIPVGHVPPLLGTRNLLYTAVTRGKSLVILVGSERKVRGMVDNNYVNRRYSGLSFRLRERLVNGQYGVW